MTSSSSQQGSFTFIGTATALIHFGDITLLTDPNFLHAGQRAYLGHGLSSKRITDPSMSISDLPDLDAVLLSHLHGDHWDREARRGLDRELPILTTPPAAKRLRRQGFGRSLGLHTWGTQELVRGGTTLRVTAMPGRHARGFANHLLPPVMGSMLEFGPLDGTVALRIYVSGDTLVVDDLAEIPARYPAIDTGILHLGGTKLPGGLMVTMDGHQGADLMQLLQPATTIPVHYDDYRVFKSPLAEFRAEVERRGVADRVTFVERGETVLLRPGLGRD